ncbi:ATP-binding protein [Ruminococcus sp. CLA-AA-H200]|uniref:ATP-binding protein n=1 Tax=Ruminococcus turbiniformis TaxID=2881258 RepID=A0ABS8FXB5_9FIRM|nr:ATP-binding protein [Ruminococcus turbiniformis]MCC2254611.1 ATP-binding protein [Ruminococcus turbiniformis]
MPKAIILVGIPGAGKTTYAKKYFSDAVYIGSDAIRKEWYGKESCMGNHRKVHAEMHRRCKETLASGKDIVIDSMNIRAHSRAKLIHVMKSAGASVQITAVFINTPLHIALMNNRRRERHVPPIGIVLLHVLLKPPKQHEGFDSVLCISPNP